MKILLTNDDGIHAPGLHALYDAIADLGDITVIAPSSCRSATSHGVTYGKPMHVEACEISRDDGEPLFSGHSVDGQPADCVKLAYAAMMGGAIDLVISGMNSGANIGVAVLYSGTVAAAREAAIFGLPSIAVSLHIGDESRTRWDLAAEQAREAIDTVLAGPMQPHSLMNINVPITDDGIPAKGMRFVAASTVPFNERFDIDRQDDLRSRYTSVTGLGFRDKPADTDVHALFDHYTTLSPLWVDTTHHAQLEAWQSHAAAQTTTAPDP